MGQKMRIVHCCDAKLPVKGYGGTERVVVWLARELSGMGHHVTLIARRGSRADYAEVIEAKHPLRDSVNLLPAETDLVQYYSSPPSPPDVPFLVYIAGNARPGERFYPNTVFVSRNHAQRHDSQSFVYNGIDPDEYAYRQDKDDYFLFLSKVSRRIKGVRTAIRLAEAMDLRLVIAGGWRPSFSRNIRYVGEVYGRRKAELLAGAKALIFPIEWEEPFGLVTVEAMVSGTPVITTPRGAMPEIVSSDVGFICKDFEEMREAVENVGKIDPRRCRRVALERFTSKTMAEQYLGLYRRIINGEKLNPWKDTL
jgi:glycosyltransferase involved in cell wall biosynthesis